MQHPKSTGQKRRYNRRRAQKNADKQNAVRETVLREHNKSMKREGRKGVERNMKSLTFWGRFFNRFR